MRTGSTPSKETRLNLSVGDAVALDGIGHPVVDEDVNGYVLQDIATLRSNFVVRDQVTKLVRAGRLKHDGNQSASVQVAIDPIWNDVVTRETVEDDAAYTLRRRHRPGLPFDEDLKFGPQGAAPQSPLPTPQSTLSDQQGTRPKSPWQKLPDLIRGTEVRKIRRRGHIGYTGDVPMTRLRGKVLSAESLLEADFLVVTDAQDDDIVEMAAQPLALPISLNGKPASWIPDYKIVRRTGVRELVEVKPLSKLRTTDPTKQAKVTARLNACRSAARAAGYTFRLVTEQEIRIQPLLYNAKLIHRHMHGFGDRRSIMRAILTLPSLSPASSVAALGSALDEPALALALAIRLDRLGHIRLDRAVQFSKATTFVVLPPSQGEQP
ncbi:hypothetical protein MCBMB27_05274 [Methylobacterium phyllosphaerae]|uniref:TnsA endonuclease N-terminal domain-containing protein n=1 Tax=Methylobacterium phyllosphaerae TaxID=418223 RepID=A0AAE8HTW4_9HYPH|nr:TnsA endonuclease N-terminal domain-containing protein [Methylobacterium phyllosphaerae]APT34565.1 hypothetical protein MCBMB27_05274 [Methylobacterium phyllosphaerae]SFH19128.1 hypothetical protein SAMN05192567_11623 [Methylobacterium phyllosphaerae]